MRKEGSDPVKPLLLATAGGVRWGGGEIKLLWQRESRLLLSVTDYQLDRDRGAGRRGWYYRLERGEYGAFRRGESAAWYMATGGKQNGSSSGSLPKIVITWLTQNDFNYLKIMTWSKKEKKKKTTFFGYFLMFSALIATDICKDGVLSTFTLRGGPRAETFQLTSG